MKVLIIEDSRLLRILEQRQLNRAGYEAIGAADGQLGLNLAREKHPDLIVLDMMLPSMSGQDILRELKNDPTTTEIPVIVVSGLSAKNERKLAQEGAAGFIEKSANLLTDGSDVLVRAVESKIGTPGVR